jgi:hypothetical protein
LYVLYTEIPWEFLPRELGVGSGMMCWWRLHLALLAELHAAGMLDWSRAVIDSSRASAGKAARNRARPGSNHHVIGEAHGIRLAVPLTGGHRDDLTQLMPLIAAIPPVRGRRSTLTAAMTTTSTAGRSGRRTSPR